jgi:hypothetical protein
MTAPHIDEVLALVGRLDDSTIEDPARDRFRAYLLENVTDSALLQTYVGQCLEKADEQHIRALRDLINHYGRLLGFEVAFGPYEWLPGQVGFDGHWVSPWGLHIVVEVKSRETFAAQRPSLARSIEQLIGSGEIPNWDLALGLYVISHPDLPVNHLEKAILDEKQTHQIRTITPQSLFVLGEMMRRSALSQQDVLTVLRSTSPAADWLVELVSRLSERPPLEEAATAVAAAEPAAAGAGTSDAAAAAGDDILPGVLGYENSVVPGLAETAAAGVGAGEAGIADSAAAGDGNAEAATAEPVAGGDGDAEAATAETIASGDGQAEAATAESVAGGGGDAEAAGAGAAGPNGADAKGPETPGAEAIAGEPVAAETRSVPAPPDLADVLECFGNCVVRTLEMVLGRGLQ